MTICCSSGSAIRHGDNPQPGQASTNLEKLVERLKNLPGVTDVAINNSLPGYNPGARHEVSVPGSSHVEAVGVDGCSANLVQVLKLQLASGSWFTESDVTSARHVAVINQTMALRFFGGADPIGQQFMAKAMAMDGQFVPGRRLSSDWRRPRRKGLWSAGSGDPHGVRATHYLGRAAWKRGRAVHKNKSSTRGSAKCGQG